MARRGGIRRQPDLWARRRWLDEGKRCYTEATRGRIRLMIVASASFVFMSGCARCHPPPASISHPSPSSSSIPFLSQPLLLPLRLFLVLIFLSSSSSAHFFNLTSPSSPLSSLFFILHPFLSSSSHYDYHSSSPFSLSSFLLPLPPRHSSFISHVLRLLVLLLLSLRGRRG